MSTTIKINGETMDPMGLAPALRHKVIAHIEANYAPDHPANVYADARPFKLVNEWITNFCRAWEREEGQPFQIG